MENFKFPSAKLSTKLLVTSLMCIIGLTYLVLAVHIWIDTEFKVSLVAESYGYMEYIELTDHAHLYLPYYWLFIFAIPTGLFMLTQYGEKLKIFFAVFPYVVTVIDIASMYLIPYLWKGFAAILVIAGSCIGTSMLALFLLIMYDVWLRKA
ncbi:hypothetical protein ACFL50_02085 [Candidatus Latescibacterota bacterium]